MVRAWVLDFDSTMVLFEILMSTECNKSRKKSSQGKKYLDFEEAYERKRIVFERVKMIRLPKHTWNAGVGRILLCLP